jgi:hypothetical protein
VSNAIANKVVRAHWNVRATGPSFLGRAAVLAQSFGRRTRSFEPKRVLVPTIAVKHPHARRLLLGIQKAFRIAYRKALEAWKVG